MSDKNKNRKKELEDFLRYSQDLMSEAERNAFERSLEQEPFDDEALEGLSSIAPEEARADLARLKDKIQKRVTGSSDTIKNIRAMWYRVAAAVAVLLVVSSVLFTIFNDRMGQLDRKVAESPEAEVEEPLVEIAPVESKVEDEEPAASEKKEITSLKSEAVKGETEIITEAETDADTEINTKEIIEAEATREEITDVQPVETVKVAVAESVAEQDPGFKAAEPARAEKIHADEVAAPAPAMAMERSAAAKSRKREAVEQLQIAGAKGIEQRSISGLVISGEDRQPLPGVVIAVKGSNTGTLTDQEGRFEISTEDDPDITLIAQFIGMEQKEIPVGDQEDYLITLEPDAMNLDEVVVIGTGPSKIPQAAGYSVTFAEYDQAQGKSEYSAALPVGGREVFYEYVKNRMQFPENEKTITRAVVVLTFTVGYDGRPAEIFVLKSPGKAFSDEAARLLKEGPDWKPAEKNGNYHEQQNRIRIVFKKERP